MFKKFKLDWAAPLVPGDITKRVLVTEVSQVKAIKGLLNLV